MSNISKTVRREKIRTQIAELMARLTQLQNSPVNNIVYLDGYLHHRVDISSSRYERLNQERNIKKKIEFLNRKLEVLEL